MALIVLSALSRNVIRNVQEECMLFEEIVVPLWWQLVSSSVCWPVLGPSVHKILGSLEIRIYKHGHLLNVYIGSMGVMLLVSVLFKKCLECC